MSHRVLITGANGFVGRQLRGRLTELGHVALCGDSSGMGRASDEFACDVSDPEQVAQLFRWAGPVSHVVHLAAITFVPDSMNSAANVMRVNLNGTISVMEAMLRHVPDARALFIGSSEAYGRPEALPVTEDHRFAPLNPYAISKAAGDDYCRYLFESRDAQIVRVRPFNHVGPGQSERFALANFACQIAGIEAGELPPVLDVGNLAARRDFTDARDVVSAYCKLLDGGEAGECYNVCSGTSYAIEEALGMLLRKSSIKIDVRVDPNRLRPIDVQEVRGSYERLKSAVGWEPRIPFDETLDELIGYFRQKRVPAAR